MVLSVWWRDSLCMVMVAHVPWVWSWVGACHGCLVVSTWDLPLSLHQSPPSYQLGSKIGGGWLLLSFLMHGFFLWFEFGHLIEWFLFGFWGYLSPLLLGMVFCARHFANLLLVFMALVVCSALHWGVVWKPLLVCLLEYMKSYDVWDIISHVLALCVREWIVASRFLTWIWFQFSMLEFWVHFRKLRLRSGGMS